MSPIVRQVLRYASAWVAGAVIATGAADAAPRAADAPVSFNKQIAPILSAHCSPCHRPGGTAPFSLTTYDEARPRARQLAFVTAERQMPPWLPEQGKGEFLDARVLSAIEIDLSQRWVRDGALEGAAADRPPV